MKNLSMPKACRGFVFGVITGACFIYAQDRELVDSTTGEILTLAAHTRYILPFAFPGDTIDVKRYISTEGDIIFICNNPLITSFQDLYYYQNLDEEMAREKYGKILGVLREAFDLMDEDSVVEIKVSAMAKFAEPTEEDLAAGRLVGQWLGPVKPVCQIIEEDSIKLRESDLQRMSDDSTDIVINANKQIMRLLMFDEDIQYIAKYIPFELVSGIIHDGDGRSYESTTNKKSKSFFRRFSGTVPNGTTVSLHTLSGRRISDELMNENITLANLINRKHISHGTYLMTIRSADGAIQARQLIRAAGR